MKKVLFLIFITFYGVLGYAQVNTRNFTMSSFIPDCLGYKYDGVFDLLENKAWQMTTWYVDSIPLNDSIPKKIKFLFASDSAQNASTMILYFIQKSGNKETALEFTYKIVYNSNYNSSPVVSIFTADPNVNPPVLQKTFTVTCLNFDHLALTYQEPAKDGSGKTLNVEMRFMADFSY